MYSKEVSKQFPVRLDIHLQKEFERVVEETHINKSKLVRIALVNLIKHIDKNNINKL